MKKIILYFLVFCGHVAMAQIGGYSISINEVNLTGLPSLQSFAIGHYQGKYLLIGGRKDGLHQRQPFASFLSADNNVSVYVVDFETGEVWSRALTELPTILQEQLQSTNIEHFQDGDHLFLIGGYGYSASLGDHTTYASLVAVDLPSCINSIVNNQNMASSFQQLSDSRLQVTGGYLAKLNNLFYLVGGQKFVGRYNPMGPTHGPGFVQEYTNAIKTFEISLNPLSISNYNETVDTVNLHRRDYNLLPQVFPNGDYGFTAFSGVFQYAVDLPWLNTVDIVESTYTVVPNFNQYLNQYHTASCPLFSSSENMMYSLFFGGISRYYIDANGVMQDDVNVPFVNTISMVSRSANGEMEELKIGEMPALLGSGAEFIHNENLDLLFNGVIDLDAIDADTIKLGYVFGGIQSSAANIFFVNDGSQSAASNRLFEVVLSKSNPNGIKQSNSLLSSIVLSPNPSSAKVNLSFTLSDKSNLLIDIFDSSGVKAQMVTDKLYKKGTYSIDLPVASLARGQYFLRIFDGQVIKSLKFVLE